MELKEFVKNVLIEVNGAVDEASSETTREIRFSSSEKDSRTVEFDIAVSVSESNGAQGKAGVKVLTFMEAGGDMHEEYKNSTVSRVTFGLNIGYLTKEEEEKNRKKLEERKLRNRSQIRL